MSYDMIVISDSRGRLLQNHLFNERIKVLFYSGATLDNMLRLSHPQCLSIRPKYILVLGGICNMSQKNRRTGVISLRLVNEADLLASMKTAFLSAWELAQQLYPTCRIMFSGLCGLDLNRANGWFGYHLHQPIIDNVIEGINQYIVELNFRAGVFQPKMTGKVHKRSKKLGHRNQYRLLDDGVHPGTIVLKDWSKNITNLFNLLETGTAPTNLEN